MATESDAGDEQARTTAIGKRAVPATSYITWTALALMTVSSVASLRPAPTMAMVVSGLRTGVLCMSIPRPSRTARMG